jgi:hypothetical protein
MTDSTSTPGSPDELIGEDPTSAGPQGPAAAAEQLEAAGEPDPGAGPDANEAAGDGWKPLISQLLAAWNLLASDRTEVWVFASDEVEVLAEAWAPVCEKWLPETKIGPELGAILVTLAVVAPRLEAQRFEQARPAETE